LVRDGEWLTVLVGEGVTLTVAVQGSVRLGKRTFKKKVAGAETIPDRSIA
jgi:hypothetical protein